MKWWCTTVYAKCAESGEMKSFFGPNIQAPTLKLAHDWCQNNGLGYCRIEGELESEIPCKEGTFEPDWKKEVDYSKFNDN